MMTVGILGGGQLARMLAMAAVPLGVRVLVLDTSGDACAGAQRGDGTNEVTTTDSLADRFGGRACKHFIHRPQATDVLLHPCCRGVYDVYGSPVGVRGWPAAMTVPPVGLEPTLDGF